MIIYLYNVHHIVLTTKYNLCLAVPYTAKLDPFPPQHERIGFRRAAKWHIKAAADTPLRTVYRCHLNVLLCAGKIIGHSYLATVNTHDTPFKSASL